MWFLYIVLLIKIELIPKQQIKMIIIYYKYTLKLHACLIHLNMDC